MGYCSAAEALSQHRKGMGGDSPGEWDREKNLGPAREGLLAAGEIDMRNIAYSVSRLLTEVVP